MTFEYYPDTDTLSAENRNLIGLAAFILTSAIIIGFGESMRRAHNRAREQQELLRITLSSIGDAVITTDLKGRVTYLNEIAEKLTGWRRIANAMWSRPSPSCRPSP